jgi:hypothetical protein
VCILHISTVGYRVVNVGACNRSDNDGCSRAMPLGILVVSSLPRSYSTYNRDTDTVRKLITCPLRLRTRRYGRRDLATSETSRRRGMASLQVRSCGLPSAAPGRVSCFVTLVFYDLINAVAPRSRCGLLTRTCWFTSLTRTMWPAHTCWWDAVLRRTSSTRLDSHSDDGL